VTPRAAAAPPELPGLTFVETIGSGGYADVYLYEQAMPKMRVAVKVLSVEGMSEEVRRRFTAEANAMAALAGHPNIVQVFRAGATADGRPFLVMQYYPQRNLAVRARTARLPVPEVLAIGVRIACAVETAHRAGILHRDIKPANILTSQYGEPGLTDFGIATTTEETVGSAEGMSIPWAPPEVVFQTSQCDQRSDVYSLGATLWHLLVGRSPFDLPGGDNSSFAMMRRIREQPPPRTGREDVPASLERVLAQAMAKDPASRPPSALSLARSLKAIEIEERWAPTPIVLLDEGGEAATAGRSQDADGSDRTVLRGPRVVAAQAAPPAYEEASQELDLTSSPPEGTTLARPGVVGGSPVLQRPPSRAGSRPGRTDQGPVPPPPAAAEAPARAPGGPVPVETPSGRGRLGPVVGIAVAAILVIGAVAVLASHAGGSTKAPTSTPTPVSAGTVPPLVQEDAPGTPVVTWARASGTEVTFSWTYADPQSGDDFQWRTVSGAWTLTTAASATVTDPTGQQVCIEVQVGRADGVYSQISSPTCGG
jgi:serine/threonine protein kinase